VRFGRKPAVDKAAQEQADEALEEQLSGEAQDTPAALGPFDESEVDTEDREGIDLGSLLITPATQMEMRLQVDEDSGQVIAAVLVNDEGALELRAFAASRGGGAWDDLRPQIAEETTRMGGTVTEQEGSFGNELLCSVPVQTPDGAQATQASRVIGHEGPRWLLRATLLGRPAVEPELAEPWEQTIRNTVVRRGRDAMAPGTPLTLELPPQARRVE
jgi:hypothetical protein